MKTVTKRELNQQTAHVLEQVVVGESVVVTERGVPRWRIEVFTENADPVARLESQGRITRAKAHPAPWPDDPEALYTQDDVDAIHAEMRGDH